MSADNGQARRQGLSFCEVLYFWDIAEKTFIDGAFIDRPAFLDASSPRKYPFADDAALCIADFSGDFGKRSPRNLCQRLIAEVRSQARVHCKRARPCRASVARYR